MEPRLIKPREASVMLGVSMATLRWWRMRGLGPDVVQLGKASFRYDREQLIRYIESRVVKSTVPEVLRNVI